MNVFDRLSDLAINTTSALMGTTATWVKDDSHTYSALVKYNDGATQATMGDKKISTDRWWIELRDSDFPGLNDLVNGNKKPTVTVDVRGVQTVFYATRTESLSDGKLSRVILMVKPANP